MPALWLPRGHAAGSEVGLRVVTGLWHRPADKRHGWIRPGSYCRLAWEGQAGKGFPGEKRRHGLRTPNMTTREDIS